MKYLLPFTYALAAFFIVAQPQSTAQSLPVDGYAAVVNDRVILLSDVLNLVKPVEAQLRAAYKGAELEKKINEAYETAMTSLIDQALILEEFKSQEIQLPESVVDTQVNEIIVERFKNDRTAFMEAMAQEQVTFDEWRDSIREKISIILLRRREVVDRVSISPVDVRKTYDRRIDEFKVPEKVKVRMITLNKGNTPEEEQVKREEAEKTRAKILDGEDFSDVARQVSEGSKASEGGDWGWIEPTHLRGELTEVLRELEPGAVSEVITSDDAFYILKVEARKNAGIVPFEDVRGEIEEELRKAEMDRLYRAWTDRLRKKFYVKVF